VLHSLCQPGESNGLTSCFLLCMRSPSRFFSPDRGEILRLDVARGRNTLFQPVPFPSIRRPGWPGGGSLETRITACFCEGTYPRRHGENIQTPHREALSPTPPRVWALMTRRREHAPSAHSVPSGNRTQDLLAVRRQRYRLRHRAPEFCFSMGMERFLAICGFSAKNTPHSP